MSGQRWTPEEDRIVRSNPVKVAVGLLAGRTSHAIIFRRKTLGVSVPLNRWTKAEDRRIIKTAALPAQNAVKFFKNRNANAIRYRRACLGTYVTRRIASWQGYEVKLLRQMWPTSNLSTLKHAIPRHSEISIARKAKELGLKRVRKFEPSDIIDQIRLRTREDGISTRRLCMQLNLGELFRRRPNIRPDFNKIAKAIEFFGGRLVIDWCDE